MLAWRPCSLLALGLGQRRIDVPRGLQDNRLVTFAEVYYVLINWEHLLLVSIFCCLWSWGSVCEAVGDTCRSALAWSHSCHQICVLAQIFREHGLHLILRLLLSSRRNLILWNCLLDGAKLHQARNDSRKLFNRLFNKINVVESLASQLWELNGLQIHILVLFLMLDQKLFEVLMDVVYKLLCFFKLWVHLGLALVILLLVSVLWLLVFVKSPFCLKIYFV